MASIRRSALAVVSRSMAFRSATLTQSCLKPAAPIPSSIFASTGVLPRAARYSVFNLVHRLPASPKSIHAVSALGVDVSSMPLHSAIASARLKSRIGVEASCWSFFSQGFATPL